MRRHRSPPGGPPKAGRNLLYERLRTATQVSVFYLSYLFRRKKWNIRLHNVLCEQYRPARWAIHHLFMLPILCLVAGPQYIAKFVFENLLCVFSCGHAYISCIKKPYRKCRFLGYFDYKRAWVGRLYKDAFTSIDPQKNYIGAFCEFAQKQRERGTRYFILRFPRTAPKIAHV